MMRGAALADAADCSVPSGGTEEEEGHLQADSAQLNQLRVSCE